ncbi:hypothetical protein BCR32DRAFT_327601 [Anaeromyces robustus]|uniref:Dickkopf N-terminal cysteine-rich domain-containing protein n=1 Tax=Anaeromyces robustus TaxID=1754192 RepID=A0A1Y1X4W4_9FUNG|nr:hypothetical protein BCR32DRAFT_327601 [Anaeromyces robustus]|eukprot:ORX80685.1 hypothetical protein BCR32DRAFT_327601 [Anaeromyces robustus]
MNIDTTNSNVGTNNNPNGNGIVNGVGKTKNTGQTNGNMNNVAGQTNGQTGQTNRNINNSMGFNDSNQVEPITENDNNQPDSTTTNNNNNDNTNDNNESTNSNDKTIFQIENFNVGNIENELQKYVSCKSDNDCLNVGYCDKKAKKCVFEDIYCNINVCQKDNKGTFSYVKHAQSQYLKESEKNPILIFESCPKDLLEKSCITRKCESNEQCLSENCVDEQCLINSSNPIRYCTNKNKHGDIEEFKCKLFIYEKCITDGDCYSNHCGKLNDKNVCLEASKSFMNIVAGTAAYGIVVVILILLYNYYKNTKKNK